MAPDMVIIDSGYFYAAVVLSNNKVVRYAPILKYMNEWQFTRVMAYCSTKKWMCQVLYGP